ncbi:MAG: class I SAM-dependent methyltransferase [Proteobacteria bacterium]|nr:class I SAM-dependent methyltransferase [Pseudomonadota bacterium]
MNSEPTYDKGRHLGPTSPSPWVSRFAPLAPAGGAVLDLACGGGRHGRHFLERGHPVVLLDRDVSDVQDLAGCENVEIIEADLEGEAALPFAGRQFAAIVVTNYLWRPILPLLANAVAEGGVLIYETFGLGNEAYSRPRNPDHLLRPGELLEAFGKDLQVVAYEHGLRRDPKPRVIQRIAAVKSDAPVPIEPESR